jgi:hypothetical protein
VSQRKSRPIFTSRATRRSRTSQDDTPDEISPIIHYPATPPVAKLAHTSYYFYQKQPENLIYIPPPMPRSSITEIWNFWNGQLRRGYGLDQWHQGLIEELGDGFNEITGNPSSRGWGSPWIKQYRYYRVIGQEIERRLNIGGHSLEQIIDRLEVIRWSEQMNGRKTIGAFVDVILIAQGKRPFNSKPHQADLDITDLLEDENY